MNFSPERQLAHARVLRARGSALPPGHVPGGEILDSWARCMEVGLDFAAAVPVVVVEAADLERRRDRAAHVRRLAQAELETLAPQIAGSNFLLAFADPGGVILDVYNDNRFAMSGSSAAIVAGSCWSEALCGTNGLGTALACGRSVAVSGLEHYVLGLGDISCTAAPVRDAHGELVGVLDASSFVLSRQQHTHALVQMAATHMENALLTYQMRQHLVLAIHPRAEFLGTLNAGMLAFDGRGCLLAFNARARQLLNGLQVRHGTAFAELFGQSFEQAQGQLHHSAEFRLRDALGSALVARCVNRPAVAAPAGSAGREAAPRPAPASALPMEVVAADTAVAEAFRMAEAAVRMRAPILIHGETGSGKEVLARHAHEASGRSGAFVAVNCAALPDEHFEAELFGYAGGTCTGARRDGRAGLIAGADGGTLLLDEIRELPMMLQTALLRFLDDGMLRPVGATASRHVDVQVLATTNADLEDEVAAGRIRADLMYRLNTVRVELPPLRQRRDFGAAVRCVLRGLDPVASIEDDAIQRLAAHRWPGNFRELRSVLTRVLMVHDSGRLRKVDVEPHLPAVAGSAPGSSVLQRAATEAIRREYERTGHSVSQTSRNLGVSRTTVYRHLGTRG